MYTHHNDFPGLLRNNDCSARLEITGTHLLIAIVWWTIPTKGWRNSWTLDIQRLAMRFIHGSKGPCGHRSNMPQHVQVGTARHILVYLSDLRNRWVVTWSSDYTGSERRWAWADWMWEKVRNRWRLFRKEINDDIKEISLLYLFKLDSATLRVRSVYLTKVRVKWWLKRWRESTGYEWSNEDLLIDMHMSVPWAMMRRSNIDGCSEF